MSKQDFGQFGFGQFPATRLRRLRRSPALRALVAENSLSAADLIWPLFVIEGNDKVEDISAMPGVQRHSIDRLVGEAEKARQLGIPALALFPRIEAGLKDSEGSLATDPDNLVCRAVRAVKQAVPELVIICDVALDPYTDHGHDGLLRDGVIVNDATVEVLVQQALTLAAAGCDVIAPSDMMDGRVGAIRSGLDAAGFAEVSILSYAVKYASAFYGPFREAVGAGSQLGGDGKKTYQMNPANAEEGLREVGLDLAEGADMVMVKPGLPYLDVIRLVRSQYAVPCMAYQVSGEYAMLMAAIENGWLDRDRVILESLIAFKRAGASAVLTYFAPFVAEHLISG